MVGTGPKYAEAVMWSIIKATFFYYSQWFLSHVVERKCPVVNNHVYDSAQSWNCAWWLSVVDQISRVEPVIITTKLPTVTKGLLAANTSI